MSEPIAYLRDVDGTGSLHPCAPDDPGAIPVYAAEALTCARRDALADAENAVIAYVMDDEDRRRARQAIRNLGEE